MRIHDTKKGCKIEFDKKTGEPLYCLTHLIHLTWCDEDNPNKQLTK